MADRCRLGFESDLAHSPPPPFMVHRTTDDYHGSTSRLVHSAFGNISDLLVALEHGHWALALFNRIGNQIPLLVDVPIVETSPPPVFAPH